MPEGNVAHSIFLIFVGAAALATVALYARQAMIVAYILVGMIFGPWGLGWVYDETWLDGIAEIGIMFLLYLLGLNLAPKQLVHLFREALWVTVASSVAFALMGYLAATLFGWTTREALVCGVVMMFSSTIIGVKLLPTTTLHHQRMGQIMISILLLQDMLAIVFVLLLEGYGGGAAPLTGMVKSLGGLAALAVIAAALERLVVERLIARFDRIQEYLFLLVIAWCLGIAELGAWFGLPHSIGAFVAGVALAASPVSVFVADTLRPLRDFFLVLFFFSLGASFDLSRTMDLALVAVALTAAAVVVKPLVFRLLFARAGETAGIASEIGVRLGQISEFSLFVVVVALERGHIAQSAADAITMATVLAFVVSSYWVVMRFPTPIATSDRLRRD